MNGKNLMKIAVALLFTLWGSQAPLKAQLIPPYPYFELDSWSFDDTNWLSDLGFAPVSFANLNNPPSFDGNCLQVDSTNAAWLQYNLVESDGTNEIDFNLGTIELWVLPDWISGTGPGTWGRLIDVGAYSTNTSSSWWSLYFTRDGSTINFSSETNGVFTNYLSVPIVWDTNTWHFLALTYDHAHSQLYVDGQLATNGAGVFYRPSGEVVSNGFYVGSDSTGWAQSRAQIDDMATYNYILSADDITNDYAAGMQLMSPGGFHPTDGDPISPGVGGGGTNTYDFTNTYVSPNYGSNLWIAWPNISSNYFGGFASNTIADVEYEIQSLTNLADTNWLSQGFFLGSETTNFTPLNALATSKTNNFFIRLRSWADSDGIGIPDWWQIAFFGYVGIDPYGDPTGDGWNNLQAYENGWNPTNFYTPPAPQGLTATLNPSNSVVTLTWYPASGAVTGYTITRANPLTYTTTTFTVGLTNQLADTTFPSYTADEFIISGPATYSIVGDYAGGNSSPSAWVSPYSETVVPTVLNTPGPDGTTVLVVTHIPSGVSIFQLSRIDLTNGVNQGIVTVTNFPVTTFTNGIFTIPPTMTSLPYGAYGTVYYLQAFWPDGSSSAPVDAGGPALPFYDGSTQLDQNVSFILRAAGLSNVFSFTYDYTGYELNVPTNYAYASYYTEDYLSGSGLGDGANYQGGLGLPFSDNYLYRNFLPESTTNLNYYGFLDTGCTENSDLNFSLSFASIFQFITPTNYAPIAALDQSTYLEPYLDYQSLGMYADDSGNLRLPEGVTNWFGLPLLSVLVAQGDSESNLFTIPAGGMLPETNAVNASYFYPQFAQPEFETAGYLFGNMSAYDNWFSDGDPLPGDYDFSPTNQPLLLFAGLGQTTTFAGFTKKIVTNGDTSKPAYVAQYFEGAYQVDSNNNVTATPTGVLSTFGDFCPTVPGPVALVTAPDIDPPYGNGTCLVYAVSLQWDANHDGIMDLSATGPDATSGSSPMRFWVNDGHTQYSDLALGEDDLDEDLPVPANDPSFENCNMNEITCPRDLENFGRLWICGLPALSTNYLVTLSMSGGAAAINLYGSVETNGGTGYLTDTNIAYNQCLSTAHDSNLNGGVYYTGPRIALGQISYASSYTFPANYFTNAGNHYFLFEGAVAGSGQLTLTIGDNHNNILTQTSQSLELHEIKDFFEQAYATNVTSGKPPSSLVSDFCVIKTASPAPNETPQMITFIHGINNTDFDFEDDCQVIYKRLYWSGYNGRFAGFRWPCAYLPFNTVNPYHYNLGEFYAWKSAAALKNYLSYLRNRPDLSGYAIDLLAHSQGNIVASEALEQGATFDNYILTQGAVPAHCYDTNAPFLPLLVDADEATPTPFYAINGGYHGYFSNLHGNLINFYNTNDFALASGYYGSIAANWVANQQQQKPEAFIGGPSYIYYTSNLTSVAYYTFASSYDVTDMQESKAMVARSRSSAVGAQGGLGGVLNGAASIDLLEAFGFGDTRSEHSAQFNWPIQTAWPYYDQVMRSFLLQPINRE